MRKFFNQLFDKIIGFNLSDYHAFLMDFDTWDRESIEKFQKEKFDMLKSYACMSNIYRKYRTSAFPEFPVFSKDFVRSNFDDFLTFHRKPYNIEFTSGSTGNPKKIVLSKEMILAKRASHLKMLSWYNLNREDMELYIGGINKNLPYKFYYFIKNKIYFSSHNITPDKAKDIIRALNTKKPKIVFSYPFALRLILQYAQKFKCTLYQPELIYTGAEKMYEDVCELIKQFFPSSKLVNEYWSTEANIAVTCPHGNMHVDEDTVMIELTETDPDGFGKLLITNLYSYDFPIIRYELGDKIKLSEKACPCGRNTKIIEEIKGRTDDYIYKKDGTKISYNHLRIDNFADNIMNYQIVHNSCDDSFTMRYVPIDASKSIDEKKIKKSFKKTTKSNLSFLRADTLEFESSGKFKPILSI